MAGYNPSGAGRFRMVGSTPGTSGGRPTIPFNSGDRFIPRRSSDVSSEVYQGLRDLSVVSSGSPCRGRQSRAIFDDDEYLLEGLSPVNSTTRTVHTARPREVVRRTGSFSGLLPSSSPEIAIHGRIHTYTATTKNRVLDFSRSVIPVSDIYPALQAGSRQPAHRRPRKIYTIADKYIQIKDLSKNLCWHVLDVSTDDHVAVAKKRAVHIYHWGVRSYKLNLLTSRQEESGVKNTGVSWNPTDTGVLVGQSDGHVQHCTEYKNLSTYQCILPFCEHTSGQAVTCIVPHKTSYGGHGAGHLFYTASSKCGCVTKHDLRDPTAVTVLNRSQAGRSRNHPYVSGMALSVDGRFLAVGSMDGRVNVYRVGENRLYTSFKAHASTIRALAWCPWRTHVLTTGGSASYIDEQGLRAAGIRSWDIGHDNELVTEIPDTCEVYSLAYSEPCRELASGHGGRKENIKLWNPTNMKRQAVLDGHSGRVLYLKIAHQHEGLVSGSIDNEYIYRWPCFREAPKPLTPPRRNSVPTLSPFAMTLR